MVATSNVSNLGRGVGVCARAAETEIARAARVICRSMGAPFDGIRGSVFARHSRILLQFTRLGESGEIVEYSKRPVVLRPGARISELLGFLQSLGAVEMLLQSGQSVFCIGFQSRVHGVCGLLFVDGDCLSMPGNHVMDITMIAGSARTLL